MTPAGEHRAAAVASRLDELWARGVFRGAGPELCALATAHATHPRGDELRAFADLAVLLEGELARLRDPGAYVADPATAACVRTLGHAAATWRAAATADLRRCEITSERMQEALAQAVAAGDDPRLPAAASYADIASAERWLVLGELSRGYERLRSAADRPAAPPAAVLAARGRLAMLVGRRDPALGLSALDRVTSVARRLHEPVEIQHALLCAAMTALNAGRADDALRRLQRLLRVPSPAHALRYPTTARLLLTVLADADGDDAIRHVSEGIRLAAGDGDAFAYIVLIGLAMRLYLARGAAADALLTVTAGIQSLHAVGGDELSLPLVLEREALRHELGERGYADAVAAAHEILDASAA